MRPNVALRKAPDIRLRSTHQFYLTPPPLIALPGIGRHACNIAVLSLQGVEGTPEVISTQRDAIGASGE